MGQLLPSYGMGVSTTLKQIIEIIKEKDEYITAFFSLLFNNNGFVSQKEKKFSNLSLLRLFLKDIGFEKEDKEILDYLKENPLEKLGKFEKYLIDSNLLQEPIIFLYHAISSVYPETIFVRVDPSNMEISNLSKEIHKKAIEVGLKNYKIDYFLVASK